MKKIKRVLCIMLCAVLMMPAMAADAFNFTPKRDEDGDGTMDDMVIFSESVYMIDMETGEAIVDINSDEERTPASLTKIMTAAVLLDQFDGDEQKLKQTYYSAGTEAFDELYDTGASTADIQPDEEVSCYDLLCALMLPSSCEAANIIALNVSDSLTGFAQMMNDKAEELGMEHSHFSNAHGIFANQNYTTCKDMATLCQYALTKYPVLKEIVAMPEYHMSETDMHPDGTDIYNTNYLLSPFSNYYYDTVKGIKTGTLDTAGRCLASYAEEGGVSYMIISMGAPMEKREEDITKGIENPESIFADDTVYYNLLDHIHLYDWAYSYLVATDFIDENSEITEAKVSYGDDIDYANLKPAKGYTRYWPIDVPLTDVEQRITVFENVIAPIEIGDVLGKLDLVYQGKVIASVDLVSTTKVERSALKSNAKVAGSYFSSKAFKRTAAIIVVLIAGYIIIYVVIAQKKYLK